MKDDAALVIDDYRRRTDLLEQERHQMFDEAKVEVETSRQELLKQARIEVNNRREDWIASLNREKETLSQLVKQRCGNQVAAATRQAVRHLADADLEEQMVRSFIKNLSATHDSEQLRSPGDNGSTQATVYSAFEIPLNWRERLKEALMRTLHLEHIAFQVDSDLVCGLEVHFASQKIGWSVAEYLASLEQEFGELVQQPTP